VRIYFLTPELQQLYKNSKQDYLEALEADSELALADSEGVAQM